MVDPKRQTLIFTKKNYSKFTKRFARFVFFETSFSSSLFDDIFVPPYFLCRRVGLRSVEQENREKTFHVPP